MHFARVVVNRCLGPDNFGYAITSTLAFLGNLQFNDMRRVSYHEV